jgi:hypothetical protein
MVTDFSFRSGSDYHPRMPLDPITSAIISSVISSVVEGALTPAPVEPATGIVRILPEETKVGKMLPPTRWGEVQIDGKTYTLSPGVQIRNELNMFILPTMLQAPAKVRYQTDFTGAVYRVWILSPAEASLPANH